MALFVNNELINAKHDYYEKVTKEIAKLKKKGSVKIVSTAPAVLSEPLQDGSRSPYRKPNDLLLLVADIQSESGMIESWRWTGSIPRKDKDGNFQWEAGSRMIEEGQLVIDCGKEPDLAYFVTNVSPMLKKGFYKIEDLDKEAATRNDIISQDATLKFLIYAKTRSNPLYRSEKRLREVAASWGVQNSLTANIERVKQALEKAVLESERNSNVTGRGIQSFIDEVENGDSMTEYRANIQLGFDKNIIKWNNRDRMYYWLDATSGDFSDPILSVSATQEDNKLKFLLDFFRANNEQYGVLVDAVTGNQKNPAAKYSHLDWASLKATATERGIKGVTKMTRLEVEAELVKQDNETSV